jgi:flagellar protein FliO/FliZ
VNVWTVLSSLFAVVVALAVVLGLAYFVLKGLRRWQDRFQGEQADGERPIRFLRAMPLGQGERVVLIEVRGETLLVGVTPGGISLLKSWPQGEEPLP